MICAQDIDVLTLKLLPSMSTFTPPISIPKRRFFVSIGGWTIGSPGDESLPAEFNDRTPSEGLGVKPLIAKHFIKKLDNTGAIFARKSLEVYLTKTSAV